ncbi:MAG: hypothetical protein GY852_00525, partial [bacterium]|nr:hypothetical protein [bacterium]
MTKVHNIEELAASSSEAMEAGIEVMVQELIPGDDTCGVNYNSYFWEGEPVLEVTAEKVRLSPAGFGVPCVVVSKEIPEIMEPGRKLLRAAGFYGFSCTEFKKDPRDGVYKIMEVNGRQNRSSLLSVHCGVNFPWVMYEHLANGGFPRVAEYQSGIYWIDEFRDMFSSGGRVFRDGYSVIDFCRPYYNAHVFSVFDWYDLKPFLKRILDVFVLAVRSLKKLAHRISGKAEKRSYKTRKKTRSMSAH